MTPGDRYNDLFVHHSERAGEGRRSLTRGATVGCETAPGDRGPRAVDVDVA
jgi:cold shock CspA family protein